VSDPLDDEIAKLEAEREAGFEADAREEKRQYVADLKARIAAEEEHGRCTAVKLPRFVKGVPTFALVRAPSGAEYKRYKSMAFNSADKKAEAKIAATEMLARSCWVYPAETPEQEAMLAVASGLLSSISLAAQRLAEGKAEEEGKG
jgi:hypothetical protein